MFDLNEQLVAWKQTFPGAEAMRPGDLAELEQHLRDSFDALSAKGLTPEEAFAVALGRAGDPRKLVVEYKKVNGNYIWAQRAFWMIVGFFTLQMARMLVDAAAMASQLLASYTGAGAVAIIAVSPVVTAVGWLAVAAALSWSKNSTQENPLARLFSRRRWQLIAATALIPIAAEGVFELCRVALCTRVPQDEFTQIAMFAHWVEPFVWTALFVLLVITADRLRETAAEPAT